MSALECSKVQAFFKRIFLKVIHRISNMPFAKITGPVKRNRIERGFFPIFFLDLKIDIFIP